MRNSNRVRRIRQMEYDKFHMLEELCDLKASVCYRIVYKRKNVPENIWHKAFDALNDANISRMHHDMMYRAFKRGAQLINS